MVRATRATRTRPRPESGNRSTALVRSPDAASVRLGRAVPSRSHAATTRSRTARSARPEVPRAPRREVAAWPRRDRTGRGARVTAFRGTRRAVVRCTHTPPPGRPVRRRGTCSSCRRAGSRPGRSRGRRHGRRRRFRPQAVVAALPVQSAGTREARRGAERRDVRARLRRVSESVRPRRPPEPRRRGGAPETAAPSRADDRVEGGRRRSGSASPRARPGA